MRIGATPQEGGSISLREAGGVMSAVLPATVSVLLVGGLVAGCATPVAAARPERPAAVTHTSIARPVGVDRPSSAPRAARACVGPGSGFSLSLALGVSGAKDPVKAAAWFVAHARVPGYGDSSSAWVLTARDVSGATVTAGNVQLHTFLLKDKTWVVDGGQRCGP
jgi:hypothetical protein